MHRQMLSTVLILTSAGSAASAHVPEMLFADTSSGKVFTKDPDVVRWNGTYYLYFSMRTAEPQSALAIGIAQSDDLTNWKTIGEVRSDGDYEKKGRGAPCVVATSTNQDKPHLHGRLRQAARP